MFWFHALQGQQTLNIILHRFKVQPVCKMMPGPAALGEASKPQERPYLTCQLCRNLFLCRTLGGHFPLRVPAPQWENPWSSLSDGYLPGPDTGPGPDPALTENSDLWGDQISVPNANAAIERGLELAGDIREPNGRSVCGICAVV